MGIVAIHDNLWGSWFFEIGLLRAFDLVSLQPTDFLTPAIICPLCQPALTNRIGNGLTLRDQNVNLAEFPGNLFRFVSLPRRVGSRGHPRRGNRHDSCGRIDRTGLLGSTTTRVPTFTRV